jgi:hypothetical protein|tara:strand:+ start:394 stop:609 length:216 start_codon:yes stop_codon:yes gene_type:complete
MFSYVKIQFPINYINNGLKDILNLYEYEDNDEIPFESYCQLGQYLQQQDNEDDYELMSHSSFYKIGKLNIK